MIPGQARKISIERM
jgi:hypothetical protein